jgi:hypothetical protein
MRKTRRPLSAQEMPSLDEALAAAAHASASGGSASNRASVTGPRSSRAPPGAPKHPARRAGWPPPPARYRENTATILQAHTGSSVAK